MKKVINLMMIAIACMAVACHKNAELTTLGTVKFTGPLTTTASAVIVTPADTASTLVTFKWPAVVYPYKEQVTYTLQADLPADTLGSTPWANAATLIVGNDVLTKSFTGSQLSTLAIKAGITANDTGKVVFRLQAYQDRNVFSNSVTITVKPYLYVAPVVYSNGWPIVYMPGAYQGWNPAASQTAAAEVPNIYEGYLYEPASETDFGFKFTSEADFNGINYGNGGTNILTTDGNAGNLELPGPGLYELTANTAALTWTATPITWAIIGDATPNGWGQETEMTFNAANYSWTITLPMVSAGSFKFRANNAWNIDFGIDNNGHLQYADNPAYPYNGTLNNMTVPANATYKITLYIGNSNDYNYTAVKQ
jgi:hypothetical protein